jgi:3-dehydroquinate synthetase/predicted NBD/HSP70 family sugar kinase
LLDLQQGILVQVLSTRRALLVTTPTVAKLYGGTLQARLRDAGLHIPLLILECNESTKIWTQVERVCREAHHHGLDRKAVLIGFGGGVCTDIVTVAASWIRRGIRHLRIPTTLIGQVDAGIGIKGAVNFLNKKNYLGCFYPPELVLIDPTFLQTVPTSHLRSGLAEILKMALIRDQELFRLVEQYAHPLLDSGFARPQQAAREILQRSIVRMLEELEPNIYEDQTSKRLVDFGHTFSPLLEAASGFRLSHGEAVAIDMALTYVIATQVGGLDEASRDRAVAALVTAGLPIYSPLLTEQLCVTAIEEALRHRAGALNLVIPTTIGQATFLERPAELPTSVIASAIRWLEQRTLSTARCNALPTACLVFDIGGTNLRAALYHADSASLSGILSQVTPSHWTMPGASTNDIYHHLVNDMGALGAAVLKHEQPAVVGVAFPGPIDGHGRILAAPTVWGLTAAEPLDLLNDLQRFWPAAQFVLLNDMTAAGYRYLQRGDEDLCVITVSSGIGNKIFLKGKPALGPVGRGGEVGHVRVDFSPDAPLCDCGARGHLGAIASGRGALLLARRLAVQHSETFLLSALGQRFGSQVDTLENTDIVQAFHAGDGWAQDLIRTVAYPLGHMLASIHLGTGIERFVIIGGFALALGEPYRLELVRAARDSGWDVGQDWNAMIEFGFPDDHASLLGAGRFATEFRSV